MQAKLIGKTVLVARKEKGLSQEQLANFAQVSRNYISQIERGEAGDVSVDVVRKIAVALEIPEGKITGDPDDKADLIIPPALRQFALRAGLSFAVVDKLRLIPFRGKEPQSPEDWKDLYEAIKPFILPEKGE